MCRVLRDKVLGQDLLHLGFLTFQQAAHSGANGYCSQTPESWIMSATYRLACFSSYFPALATA